MLRSSQVPTRSSKLVSSFPTSKSYTRRITIKLSLKDLEVTLSKGKGSMKMKVIWMKQTKEETITMPSTFETPVKLFY